MRVSMEWLREYVDINITAAELADKLTMAGIAVEEIIDQAALYQGIIVGKVVSLEPHPHADHLLIVQVDCGSEIRQVITAAHNLKKEDLVPVALPGATLPSGKTISETEFRGVASRGMLCSGMELELEKESTGIWTFESSLTPGAPVAEVLDATDQILVLELTANRSDCLGMIGVAREVAAVLDIPYHLKPIKLREEGPDIAKLADVTVLAGDLAPRYVVRVAQEIRIAPSPRWMQRRLKAAGIRPINNIVDITNYVMMEYNQPLHAFDLDRIQEGRVIVRRAESGEHLVTLDGVERVLQEGTLLIADAAGGQCIAGVMGGSTSEVTDQTVNLLLESAYFDPISIRKTAKALEMRTEASFRFERGIDPEATIEALNRAAELIETLGIGKVARKYRESYPKPLPKVVVSTSYSRINSWLGTDIPQAEIRRYLERVRFTVTEEKAGNIRVAIPTSRRDVTHMADLAEEVARLYGYDRIPSTLPPSRAVGERTAFQKMQWKLRHLLQGVGISEIVTYSLTSKTATERLGISKEDPLCRTVALIDPLSEDQAVLRTTLVNGMLEAMAFNVKRRQTDLAFYEIARVYRPKPGEVLPEEPLYLTVGLLGRRAENGWNQPREEVDFYDIKGILERITAEFHLPEIRLKRGGQPFYQPGQSATVLMGETVVGSLGRIHPKVRDEYELTQNPYLLELNLSLLGTFRQEDTHFVAAPKFPAAQRDLALVLSSDITSDEVISKIKASTYGAWLENVELFDVYQGNQLEKGRRSLAFRLTYRSREKTLSDQEVNQAQAELLQQLDACYGAKVRSK